MQISTDIFEKPTGHTQKFHDYSLFFGTLIIIRTVQTIAFAAIASL